MVRSHPEQLFLPDSASSMLVLVLSQMASFFVWL